LAIFSAKILQKMTPPGLTFGEHCVKFGTHQQLIEGNVL
jgi:hypothetical protein